MVEQREKLIENLMALKDAVTLKKQSFSQKRILCRVTGKKYTPATFCK